VEIVDNKALGELVKKHNLIMHDFVDSTEIEINKKIEFLSEIITQAITKKPLERINYFYNAIDELGDASAKPVLDYTYKPPVGDNKNEGDDEFIMEPGIY
jgi:hypothetical protein